jgi:putative N6-adenine-specific DNA methylase
VNEQTSLFISCAPELEPLLAEELQEMGITSLTIGYRGVYIQEWDWATIYKINYASRLASRVLLPLVKFKCFDRQSLYRGAASFNWPSLIRSNQTFAIDANVQHKELRNSLFAAQVVKDVICDQVREKTGNRPSVNVQNPDVQLNLYIQHSTAIISFDTSGAPLHKRGYRQESVEAPIQETLAAAILRLAKYSKEDIVLDPCCGSGTLLIEAALMATKTPPGYLRRQWGFMQHPAYQQIEWLKVRNEIDQERQPILPKHFFGVDFNKNAVRVAKVNLRAAGFHQAVEIVQGDFREFVPSVPPTFLVANPPHGKRLEEASQLAPLYRALGDFMKQRCAKPSRGFIFTSNLEMTKEVGLAAKRRYILNAGGLESRLLEYDIY